jgi:hypothetical protein
MIIALLVHKHRLSVIRGGKSKHVDTKIIFPSFIISFSALFGGFSTFSSKNCGRRY